MAEQRELSGVLSRNKKRETDRQPEFKGSATIDGVAYWLSAWVKTGSEGDKFFSLSFTAKEMPKSETRLVGGTPMAPGYINSQSIFATAFNCQAISTSGARDVFGALASPSDKVTDRPSVRVFSRLF